MVYGIFHVETGEPELDPEPSKRLDGRDDAQSMRAARPFCLPRRARMERVNVR